MKPRTGISIVLAVVGCLFLIPLLLCHDTLAPTHGQLLEFGYTPADPVSKPPATEHDKPPGDYTEIITGSGTWSPDSVITPEDTLDVKLTLLSVGGVKYVRVDIDGKPVQILELKSYEQEPDRDLSFVAEGALVNESIQGGLGAAWQPLSIASVRVGLFAVVDSDIVRLDPKWIAGGLRVSRRFWRGVSVGAECGYRVFQDDGLHIGLSLGLTF